MALGAGIVLFSLTFLAYLIYRNWPMITAYRWQLDYVQLALTLVFHLCAFVIAIVGWHSLINRLAGAGDLRLNAKIYCYSAVARRLPGIAWDIATRVVMYDQAGVSKLLAGVASVLELVLITLAGTVFYIALTPITASQASELGSWPLIIALAVGAILSHPRVITWLVRKLRSDALPISLTYGDTVRWLSIYVLAWITSGLVLYATVRSVYDLSSQYLLQVIADWTLAGVLTSFVNFVPSGLGLKEVTLTLLMSRYMPEHIAVTAAIFMRLLMTGYSTLWLLISTRF
jgi:hypothetical protein